MSAITEAQADRWTLTQQTKELKKQKEGSGMKLEVEEEIRGGAVDKLEFHFDENEEFRKKRKRISGLESILKNNLHEDLRQDYSEDSIGGNEKEIADLMKLNERKCIGLESPDPKSADPKSADPESADPEFSISVSFWWGKRILKHT